MRANILEAAVRMPVPVFTDAGGIEVGYVDDAGAFDFLGTAMNLGKAAVSGGRSGGVGGALEGVAHAGTDMAATAIGGAIGGALGTVIGPVGTVLGGLAGSALGKLGSWFVGWVKNKVTNTGKGKKTVPFVKSLARKDPGLVAKLAQKAPGALALLQKDPFHLYSAPLAASLKAQMATKLAAAKVAARRRAVSRTPNGIVRPHRPSTATVVSPATTGAARVASALSAYPGLRSLPAGQLASALGVSAGDALGGISSLLAHAGLPSNVQGLDSLDAAMVRSGRPRAPYYSPNRMFVLPHLMHLVAGGRARPRVRTNAAGPDTAELTYRVTAPQTLRDVAIVCSPTHDGSRYPELIARNAELPTTDPDTPLPDMDIALPDGWVSPTAGPVPPPVYVPPSSPSNTGPGGPLPGHRYRVRSGDTGQKISALYTGSVTRWKELRDVNPGTADEQWGFKAYPGKLLVIPPSWPEIAVGPAAPSPSAPSPGAPAPGPSGGTVEVPGGTIPLPGGGTVELPGGVSFPWPFPGSPGGYSGGGGTSGGGGSSGSYPAPPGPTAPPSVPSVPQVPSAPPVSIPNPGPFPPPSVPVVLPGKVPAQSGKSGGGGGSSILLLAAAAAALLY